MTSDFPTLPIGPLPHVAMDYAALRAEGLRLLGRLSGNQWTDFNTHDPGITILEQLCYAITDLGYRANFPMADLLAESEELGLPGPAEILTGEPVTRADLRKRVLDIEGIGNAWVEDPSQPTLAFYYHASSGELRLQADPSETEAKPVLLRGLHRVLLQTTDQLQADAALEQVSERVHRGRLLGEDYELALLGKFDVWLRAQIEVGPLEDPVAVLADVIERIEGYLAPRASFISLATGQARGQAIEALFEGPRLDHGFIDQLPAPRTTLYTSDLIHAILDVPQVRALRSIEMASSSTAPHEPWALEIPPGQIASLASNSELTLLRAGLPVQIDREQLQARLVRRRLARAEVASDSRDLDAPRGRVRALARHRSVQRLMPALYGVGPLGLPNEASPQRRAQARQLEAYLLIFDQLLANGFAQLAHAHELLSPDEGGTRSYFAQPVDDPAIDTSALLSGDLASQRAWLDATVEPGDPLERRKRLLAHLLARFAEQIGDHSRIGPRHANDPDAATLADRQTFLRHYPRLSGARGSGYDLRDASSGSGLEERLRLELGLHERPRSHAVEHVLLRPLAEDAAQQVDEGEEQVPLLAGVSSSDPWSLQVSYVFEDLELGRDFEDLVGQTILAETPAHLTPHLHWFGAADGVDHWAEFEAAWTAFRARHADYRAAKLQSRTVAVELQLQTRDARDRVIDLLGFARTYPLRDIPLPANVIVAPGNPTEILLGYSQRGVDYELRHRDTGEPILVAGEAIVREGVGGPLALPTPPIEDDVSYRVLAVKREGAEQPDLRRAAWLRGVVRVEEGVDPTLTVQIRLPTLDRTIDAAKPSDARIADFGVDVEVEILLSQEGVVYQLVDHAKQDRVLSASVVGTSQTIVLTLVNVQEDLDLRVYGSKSVGDPEHPEIRAAVLDLILPLRVRANPALTAALAPAIVAWDGTSKVDVSASQASVSYQLWTRAIRDREFVFDDPSPVATIDVAEGKRIMRVERPSKPALWEDLPGFVPLGPAKSGTGKKISLPIEPAELDAFVLIQANKQHRKAPLTSANLETLPSAIQLDRALALLVRPNHGQALRLRVEVANAASQGPWLVMDGQPGVFYEFTISDAPAFSRSAYFHQRDDLDERINKGIGQLRIGVDLAISRERIPPSQGDRTTTPPPLPSLDSPPIAVNWVLHVLARKAMSGLTAALERTATLFPVPVVRAAPIAAGEAAIIVVEASEIGDRYTLIQGDAIVGQALEGSGADLELPTAALSQTTNFYVSIERSGAGLVLVRRVAISVTVTTP